MTAFLWHVLLGTWRLVRDLKFEKSRPHRGESNELARYDDVLDAWLDDDGMDATGL